MDPNSSAKNKPFVPESPDNREEPKDVSANDISDSDPNYGYFPHGAYPDPGTSFEESHDAAQNPTATPESID